MGPASNRSASGPWLTLLTSCLTVLTLCLTMLTVGFGPGVARAAPSGSDEGASAELREALDTALAQYNDAKGRLDNSVQRQAALKTDLQTTERRLESLRVEVATVSGAAYRGLRMGSVGAILGSDSPQGMLDGMTTLTYVASRDDRLLRVYKEAKRTQTEQQQALDTAISQQREQVAVMERQKQAAEAALKKAGGGSAVGGVAAGAATASPAPRNPDGSWPKEKCSVDDPTTSGCITPRTLRAYNEARSAGFTRHTSCFRSGGSGEHPKGRACDFSPTASGFLNARPSGDDKAYGDRMAGWLIGNADRLGVMYVIWYKKIWYPGSGWRAYSGDGTPAGDHYNHIHLSMV